MTATGTPSEMGALVAKLWVLFAADQPGSDFTRIYPWMRDDTSDAPG